MPTLMDQWYLTGRLASEDQAAQLSNQNTLQAMADAKQQREWTLSLLEARQASKKPFSQQQPEATPVPQGAEAERNLPSAFSYAAPPTTAPTGTPKSFGGAPQDSPQGQPPRQSESQLLRAELLEYDRDIATAKSVANPVGYAQEMALRKERSRVVKELGDADKKDREYRVKEEERKYNLLAGVTNKVALNAFAKEAGPDFNKKMADAGIFPDFRTGEFELDDGMKQIIANATQNAQTVVQRNENAKRLADITNDIAMRKQAAENAAETVRNNNMVNARGRETNLLGYARINADKTIANTGLTKDIVKFGAALRDEQTAALKPLEKLAVNLSQITTHLETSNTASDRQLNAALVDLDGDVRATNVLFQDNKNFGSLGGKIAGFVSQTFTGRYTKEQRDQIRAMVDGLSTEATAARGRIGDYYKGLAKDTGVPEKLVKTPNFYSGKPNVNANNPLFEGLAKDTGAPETLVKTPNVYSGRPNVNANNPLLEN